MQKRRVILPVAERMREMLQKEASLRGKTILITRPREQSEEFVAEIEKRGGCAVVISMIQISGPKSWNECDAALDRRATYDAIVFTSTNAVAKFFQRARDKGATLSQFIQLATYAVGEKTKEEIEKRGLIVRFVPEEFSAEALSHFFMNESVLGKRFLFPRGNLGNDELASMLRELGAEVDAVEVYNNVSPDEALARELKGRFLKKEFDVITFASPSAVRNFAAIISPALFGQVRHKTRIAVIGPTTREATLDLQFNVDIEATNSTTQGLVDAISNFYSNLNPEP